MSVKGRSKHKLKIEQQWGKPFLEVVRELATTCQYAQNDVARLLGISTSHFSRMLKGEDVEFIKRKEWFNLHKKREVARLQAARQAKGHIILVTIDGETMTLKQACQIKGGKYKTAITRYKRGVRGDALYAPKRLPAAKQAHKRRCYRLGLTQKDWDIILEYVKKRSINSGQRKFDIPTGAIKAALAGEWERLY